MTAHLPHDHHLLRDLSDRLERYLDRETPPQEPEFARLRWMLVREMTLHLATERAVLARWRGQVGRMADRFDFALEDAFKQHVVAWSGATMIAIWPRYRIETRELLGRMRRRMDMEESAVFPA